jgi:transcriptional regulator with XRE-family HTH domain
MIGDNVKKLRKKNGLTQDALARKADIPYTTLTKLESNVVKKPSVQTIAKIAKALNVNIEELIK